MLRVETLRLLADIGFMATGSGFSPQAECIFRAIEVAKPRSLAPHIGLALNCMNNKQHQMALDILEKKALPLEPENPIIRAYVGMALMMLGRASESERCLTAVARGDDEPAKTLATQLLSQLRQPPK